LVQVRVQARISGGAPVFVDFIGLVSSRFFRSSRTGFPHRGGKAALRPRHTVTPRLKRHA